MTEHEIGDNLEITLTWRDAVLKIAVPVGLLVAIITVILNRVL